MTERTYGTYAFGPDKQGHHVWTLDMEPAVAIRAKRTFSRSMVGSKGCVVMADTPEVCRDIEWFLLRYPLTPASKATTERLRRGADGHRELEQSVHQVMVGERRHVHTVIAAPKKQPREYQQKDADLLAVRKRYLLTDAVGLGKTFTGLLSINHTGALPALVVPPTHLVSRWVTEIEESFPHLRFEAATKGTPPQHILDGDLPDVLIVPYSKIANWQPALTGRVKSIIGDEIQDLRRGTDTQKGKAFRYIAEAAEYALGTTATPIYNMGGEIWSVMHVLGTDALGTSTEFTREWGSQANNGIRVTDPAILGNYLREQGLMFGHTRAEVGRELPDTIPVYVDADADQDILENLRGDAAEMARLILRDSTSRLDRFQAAGDLDWRLRQATGIAKAPFVAEYIRTLLTMEKNALLFGWHRAVYDIWKEQLAEFKPVLYTGSETTAQKDAAAEKFKSGESRLLIMSLRSGAGLDGIQHVSNNVVFGELDWSPQVHKQGIGRLERDGMDLSSPVVAHWLTSNSGSDPVIAGVLGIKRRQSEPLLDKNGLLNSTPHDVIELGRGQALARHILGDEEATRLIDEARAKKLARLTRAA